VLLIRTVQILKGFSLPNPVIKILVMNHIIIQAPYISSFKSTYSSYSCFTWNAYFYWYKWL